MTDKNLIEAAMKARVQAHAPYSNHPVGAAVLTDDGRIFAGCNVENASSPLGACAERGAVSAMVHGGSKKLVEVAVVGPTREICTPCGGCRQVLAEFGDDDTLVHMINGDTAEVIVTRTLGELLPYAFRRDA